MKQDTKNDEQNGAHDAPVDADDLEQLLQQLTEGAAPSVPSDADLKALLDELQGDTGRAAFEAWEALGEDADAHWNLSHGAALIVSCAEECRVGEWALDATERRATALLLDAIEAACRCVRHALTVAPKNGVKH